jgi:SPP1 family predicted phage head-tail adaptor
MIPPRLDEGVNNTDTLRKAAFMKLKDKKIEILSVQTSKDADGFSSEQLTPIAPPLWAYFRQLSGAEMHVNSATVPTEDVQFVINWRGDITTRHIIRFRGMLYDITRIDTFEGYREDLTVYGARRGREKHSPF